MDNEAKLALFKKTLEGYRKEIDKHDNKKIFQMTEFDKREIEKYDGLAKGYLNAVVDFGILDKEVAEDVYYETIVG